MASSAPIKCRVPSIVTILKCSSNTYSLESENIWIVSPARARPPKMSSSSNSLYKKAHLWHFSSKTLDRGTKKYTLHALEKCRQRYNTDQFEERANATVYDTRENLEQGLNADAYRFCRSCARRYASDYWERINNSNIDSLINSWLNL